MQNLDIKNGKLYDCSQDLDPEKSQRLFMLKELMYDFNHSRPKDIEYRKALMAKIFAEIGDNCYIEPPFNANWGCNTHLGNNFYANFNLTLVDDADIFIGDDVMIAPNVIIDTGTHPVCPELRAHSYQYNLPVHIGNRVWIGAGAIILPGVTIGDGSVIGAGSVVTKDIPPYVVAVGNPCKVLREINQNDYKYYHKGMPIPDGLLDSLK